MRNVLLVSLLILGIGGCAPTNRDDLAKEVLKTDPSFSLVLDKHRELRNRIDTYEQELALKRSTVDRTIKQLRRDLSEAVLGVQRKIQHTKQQMAPDHERLTLALSMASEELKVKRLHRASLGRSMAQLRKAAQSEGTPAAERAKQQAQLDEMLADASRLDQELATLRGHVRLLKVKLLLIKL